MIIFNEEQQYNNLQKNGFEKFINLRDLIILARRFRICYDDDDFIRKQIIDFCNKKTIDFNEVKYAEKIDDAIALSKKDSVIIKDIFFDRREIDFICDNALNIQEQKMLFLICALAKWQNHGYIYLNSDSLIQPKDLRDLFKTAILESECLNILFELRKKNKIDVDLTPLLKISVCHNIKDKTDKDAVLSFIPNEDMIFEFQRLKGDKIFACDDCGRLFKPSHKARYAKWCTACARKNHKHKNS